MLWNTYDDTAYWGTSECAAQHNLNFYYIYDLPFWRDQNTLLKNLLGGWQVSGATFMRSGAPPNGRLGGVVQTSNDIAGVGDVAVGQPWDLVGDIDLNYQLYTGPGTEAFNTAAFRAPAAGTFGNAPNNIIINPGEMQWDLAMFKNFSLDRQPAGCRCGRKRSTSSTTRTLVASKRIRRTPTSAASPARPGQRTSS